MTEFLREIRSRLDAARQSLDAARQDDDDYLVQVLLGEVESLERLESEHRDESIEATGPVIDLRDGAPAAVERNPA